MTLEDIVSSLEICKQIPNESFEDSALVWAVNGSACFIEQRELMEYANRSKILAPAPTLQEILCEMAANHPNYIREITVEVDAPIEFTVVAHTSDYYDDNKYQYDANAATAALKLWLDLTKGGKDGK